MLDQEIEQNAQHFFFLIKKNQQRNNNKIQKWKMMANLRLDHTTTLLSFSHGGAYPWLVWKADATFSTEAHSCAVQGS